MNKKEKKQKNRCAVTIYGNNHLKVIIIIDENDKDEMSS